MRTLVQSLVLCLTIRVVVTTTVAVQAPKKNDSRIKIQGTGVELVSVDSGASQCRDIKNGMTVKFKVTSSSAIDIRLRISGSGISTVTKDFANQMGGSELSDYMCIPNAQYTVLVRPAGSSQAWPSK